MSPKMLIVDDEEPILFALSDFFTMNGFEVECARELEDAERLLDAGQFAVVIADLRLTGINGTEGLELISYVREKSEQTKVLLLTAYGTAEIQNEAKRRGVDAFLQKPKPLAEVAGVVAAMIKPALTGEYAQ
jgi:two-component system response regulator (stage 0 sporulation protein F)